VGTSGGDASDVLRRVPLLSVDLEGNVTLRGSANLQILINGRPSGIFTNNVADALKSIPADQIKNVEVITTPSAKYDGEGTAGIINIITKKKEIQGISGSANSSIGTRQNSAGLNISAAKGRFGLNAGGNTFFAWPRQGSSELYREVQFPTYTDILEQTGATRNAVLGYNGSVSAFYDVNAYHGFSSSVRYNGFNRWEEGTIDGTLISPDTSAFQRQTDNRRYSNGFDWTTDYRRTFDKPEQEFSMAFQWSGNFRNQNSDNQQDDLLGNAPELLRNEVNTNDGTNNEYTIQADYAHPFNPSIKLETGVKSVIRRIGSDYELEQFDFGSGMFVGVPQLTDIFSYDQDVYAGYLSFNLKVGKKFGAVIGSRYEYTFISGEYQSEKDPFSNEYGNLLPSIILSQKLGNFQTLKLSYNRRIQRPSLFFINPFIDITDPFNQTVGNPLLDPEVTDQVELNFNTFIKGVVLNASVFYRFTSDNIERFTQTNEEGASETVFFNAGRNQSIGGNFFGSMNIKKWLSLRASVNVFTYDAQGNIDGQELSNQAILLSGNMGFSLNFKGGWKSEAFGFYRAPRQTLQGFVPSFSLLSIGFQKEIWDKKADIGIRIVEPFVPNKRFPSELEGPGFYQRSEFVIPFQSFGVSFNYRFGKLDFKAQRRRSKISNDDVKEGGNNNF
jgi:ferric enterobactin receptor